jgi:selenium donor protein
VSFRGLEANTILAELNTVAASAGAACHTDRVDVSSVLSAMKVPVEYAMGTIRLSTGRFTTEQDIDRALDEISAVVERLRPAGAPETPAVAPGTVKLTQFTHGLGCACKLRPQLLEQVLRRIPPAHDDRVLVGLDTSDDAAVYKVDAQTAIVETVDFFTPVLDDPFEFGAVAAANSLSDIYAMGARPLFALSVVGFPSNRLPMGVLEEILRGATSVTDSAGISIVGGHTVDDTEPKFGLVVTGTVHPDRVVTNRTARPGDVLILTKPIGTGILSTALKQGLLDEPLAKLLFSIMSALNREAAEAMLEAGVHACTDVTGFGLLGHLLEMMRGSGTSAEIDATAVPVLEGARELATGGVLPGGSRNNMDYTAPHVRYDDRVSSVTRMLLNDAQTSGGLLIAVPLEKAGNLIEDLGARGVLNAARIGTVSDSKAGTIVVNP